MQDDNMSLSRWSSPGLFTPSERSNFFEAIPDAIPEFVVYYDDQPTVAWANKAGFEDAGFTRAAVVVFLGFLLSRYAGIGLIIEGTIPVVIMLVAPRGVMGFLPRTGKGRSFLAERLLTRKASQL